MSSDGGRVVRVVDTQRYVHDDGRAPSETFLDRGDLNWGPPFTTSIVIKV